MFSLSIGALYQKKKTPIFFYLVYLSSFQNGFYLLCVAEMHNTFILLFICVCLHLMFILSRGFEVYSSNTETLREDTLIGLELSHLILAESYAPPPQGIK